MSAPVIGLTTYRERAAYGVWDQPADLLSAEYADAVTATGGVPVLLPPVGGTGTADVVAGRLDGLVISGGADVDPARYGQEWACAVACR
jgi:putative glutamine amidotransferase